MDCLRPRLAASTRLCLRHCRRAQCLHSTPSRFATPIAHATRPSPPPPPPVPDISQPEDRDARKEQLELLRESLNEKKPDPLQPRTVLQKRFWKHVSIKETDEGLQIYLDSRPVRTASKAILTVPKNKRQLAAAIALEWDLLVSAQQALKHHYIPLTSLSSRAIDIQDADLTGDSTLRDSIVAMALKYFETDTLLCWAPEHNRHTGRLDAREEGGETLRAMQMRIALPIIAHLTSTIWPGVEIRPVLEEGSILPVTQPQMTLEVVKGWLSALSAYDLAGLERGVLASKSLLVAVRLLVEWSEEFRELRKDDDGLERFGIDEAAEACSVEVRWQTGMWGEVEDTHDVEREDLLRQLGSVVMLVHGDD